MVKYLVKTKYGGVRLQYSLPEPGEFYITVDELPAGDGPLHITEDGRLIRLSAPASSFDGEETVDLVAENKLLKAQLQAQTERSDFLEDCIAEMATVVYGGV